MKKTIEKIVSTILSVSMILALSGTVIGAEEKKDVIKDDYAVEEIIQEEKSENLENSLNDEMPEREEEKDPVENEIEINKIQTERIRELYDTELTPESYDPIAEEDVPEVIAYETALENKYTERLYEEEAQSELPENTVIFRNADGTKTLHLFEEPIKYEDEDGTYKEKSLKISGENTDSYENSESDIKTTFSKSASDGVILDNGDINITMVPKKEPSATQLAREASNMNLFTRAPSSIKVNEIEEADISADEDIVSYRLDKDTRIDYTLTYTGIKEDIVLEKYAGKSDFSFTLKTNGLELFEENGKYAFRDSSGNVKAFLGDIIVLSGDGKETSGNISSMTNIPCEEYTIIVGVSEAYLTDPNTVYPVTIDPTVTVSSSTAIADASIWSDDPNKNLGTSKSLYVGYDEGFGNERSLIKFPGLNLNPMQTPMSIISATFEIYDANPSADSLYLNCDIFNGGDWSESTVTWNKVDNRLSATTTRFSFEVGSGKGVNGTNKYSLDITEFVKLWKSGTYKQSNGMVLYSDDAEYYQNKDKSFRSKENSSSIPRLVVRYSTVPQETNIEKNKICLISYKPDVSGANVTWNMGYNNGVVEILDKGTYSNGNCYIKLKGKNIGYENLIATYSDSTGKTYRDVCRVNTVFNTDVTYRIKNVVQKKYLSTVNNGGTAKTGLETSALKTAGELGEYSQYWKITRLADGTYSIHPLLNLKTAITNNSRSSSVYLTLSDGYGIQTDYDEDSWKITLDNPTSAGSAYKLISRKDGKMLITKSETSSTVTASPGVFSTFRWNFEEVTDTISDQIFIYNYYQGLGIGTSISMDVAIASSKINTANAATSQEFTLSIVKGQQYVSVENGRIHGLKPGFVILKVTSKAFPTISKEINLYVYNFSPGRSQIKSAFSQFNAKAASSSVVQTGNYENYESNTDYQSWDFESVGNSLFKITNAATGLCLTAPSDTFEVTLSEYEDTKYQNWRLESTGGTFKIVPESQLNSRNRRVLSVSNSTEGSSLRLETDYSTTDQQWKLDNFYPITLNVMYDRAFGIRYSSPVEHAKELMAPVKKQFYEKFKIKLKTNYAFELSYPEKENCPSAAFDPDGLCTCYTLAKNHHTAANFLISRIPSDTTSFSFLLTGHRLCSPVSQTSSICDDIHYMGAALDGRAFIKCTLEDTSLNRQYMSTSIFHEIGHFFAGKNDHYDDPILGVPGSNDKLNQNRNCLYGEDNFTQDTMNEYKLCSYCKKAIEEGKFQYYHKN